MTLDEARVQFEAGFQLGPGGNSASAPTGEAYSVVVSGGTKEEGGYSPALYTSAEQAVRAWLEAAHKCAPADKTKTLYWRSVPELNECTYVVLSVNGVFNPYKTWSDDNWREFSRPGYIVYSHFLVSDKPVIQSVTIERAA